MHKLFYNSYISDENFNITLNTTNVEDMSYMFFSSNLKKIDLSSFETKNVKNMCHMLEGSASLNYINLDINTNNVEDMSYMFKSCGLLNELDLSKFNTEKVKDMPFMFKDCMSLRSIKISNLKQVQLLIYLLCFQIVMLYKK